MKAVVGEGWAVVVRFGSGMDSRVVSVNEYGGWLPDW